MTYRCSTHGVTLTTNANGRNIDLPPVTPRQKSSVNSCVLPRTADPSLLVGQPPGPSGCVIEEEA